MLWVLLEDAEDGGLMFAYEMFRSHASR